jgi:dipeptidyl aminopeptidase/acylaminoacyl peptidase
MFFTLCASAQQPLDASNPPNYIKAADILYAVIDGRQLGLDLYMPNDVDSPPLLVWVHGGRWLRRTKEDVFTTALVGVTNGNKELEGSVGEHLDQSSDVQAVVSYFGASNLTSILDQSTPFGITLRSAALALLLGGSLEQKMELAKLASPVFHVDATDPPLLLLHGDQDPQMPINQAHELHGVYKEHGLPVHFEVIHGAVHGSEEFFDQKRNALVTAFLKEHLR